MKQKLHARNASTPDYFMISSNDEIRNAETKKKKKQK